MIADKKPAELLKNMSYINNIKNLKYNVWPIGLPMLLLQTRNTTASSKTSQPQEKEENSSNEGDSFEDQVQKRGNFDCVWIRSPREENQSLLLSDLHALLHKYLFRNSEILACS